jgi:SWI/SNF-related matrix-associated actin-dependent regulator of chromatin subfamily A3
MIRNTSFSSQGYRTFNALQRLNILRLICSHGLLSQSNFVPAASQLSQRCPPIWSQNNTADSFYSELLSGSSTCFQCGMDLLEDLLEGSPSAGMDPSALESKRRTALCERCASQGPQTEPSESSPPHPDDPLDTLDSPIDERLSSTGKVQSASLIDSMPTKLKALTEDLVKHSMAQKWLVFNTCTHSLIGLLLILQCRFLLLDIHARSCPNHA